MTASLINQRTLALTLRDGTHIERSCRTWRLEDGASVTVVTERDDGGNMATQEIAAMIRAELESRWGKDCRIIKHLPWPTWNPDYIEGGYRDSPGYLSLLSDAYDRDSPRDSWSVSAKTLRDELGPSLVDTDPALAAAGVLTATTDSRGLRRGDRVFVYDGGRGLVTRLEGWALSAVDWTYGGARWTPCEEAKEWADSRKVAVFRRARGALDIAARPVALAAAEGSWHLVQDDGTIVAGGPRRRREGSMRDEELERLRDSDEESWPPGYSPAPWLAGSHVVHGVPATARRSRTVDHRQPAPDGDFFTGARGGIYIWCDPPADPPDRRSRRGN